MRMRIRLMRWAGSLTLVGVLVSACVNSDQARPAARSGASSGAPWARDLNEPPPNREPANGAAVAGIKADLNAAREKASR